MDILMLLLHVAQLPVRLIGIGYVRETQDRNRQFFQHRHNLFELHYILEGECVIRIGETLYSQESKRVYLISPGVYHSQKSCSSPFLKICVSFQLLAPPQKAEPSTVSAFHALRSAQYFACDAGAMEETLLHLRTVFDDYKSRILGLEELRIITELLILQLLQRICVNSEKRTPQESMSDIQRVYQIDEFFNNNFNCNSGDAILAQKLCVSVRQLNRIIQSLYGRSFREKMLEIRLEVALDLLASSEKSIAEISEITGYSCPANFSTFIKNATGKTPSEVRRSGYSRPPGGRSAIFRTEEGKTHEKAD